MALTTATTPSAADVQTARGPAAPKPKPGSEDDGSRVVNVRFQGPVDPGDGVKALIEQSTQSYVGVELKGVRWS